MSLKVWRRKEIGPTERQRREVDAGIREKYTPVQLPVV